MSALARNVRRLFIVAYREDTGQLERALQREGFQCTVVRPHYTEEELGYTRHTRCLLNHGNVWRRCVGQSGFSMVVEADFVPVVGLGQIPLPFDADRQGAVLGYLYGGGPRLYELEPGGYARGHAACTVAYLLDAEAAKVLLEFLDQELTANDPHQHVLWDTYLCVYARQHGVASYIPYRQYGEHGGLPNPEHFGHGNPYHQAEVLHGRLHFLPVYARGSLTRFVVIRILAKLRGIARLLTGRYLELGTAQHIRRRHGTRQVLKMFLYGAVRLWSIH